MDRSRRTRFRRINHRYRRIRLPHGQHLPACPRQPVSRERSRGNLFPLGLRRSSVCAARLLRLETRPAIFLCERGRAARSHARHPLHAERQCRGRAQGCADEPTPDLYSPAISVKSIHPGTLIYDPNGHVATIYRVDPDGRINYIDAHPDNSLTRGFYDIRFVRSRPGMGAGFKNWRPITLVGATRRSDGVYVGGHDVLPPNKNIADFSETQFFGTGARPAADSSWAIGGFALAGENMDYYDYVRAVLAGGKLEFDPVKEVHDMVDSNCADLHYRGEAVDLAIAAGLQNQSQPERLPANIYGTEGDWETYSSPSRDARLKTAFKELRDQAQRFVKMYQAGDKKLVYQGSDLVADLIATYDREAAVCQISYTRSDGSKVNFGYETARHRLFLTSFDPYQCIERRWGATDPAELSTCRDGERKQAWYLAEQNLRNQLDRTYDAQMDFTLDELRVPGPGKGVVTPPDIDTRAYLASMVGVRPGKPQSASR